MNFVPFPIWLSNFIVPFRASTRRFTTTRPSPWPFALVVIMGENSLGFISSGIPIPVSSTVINTLPLFKQPLKVHLPPLGID